MRIEFNRTGAERKELVAAIGEILEVKPKYKGMPSAAYEINYFTVTRDGALEFDGRADSGEIENLLERLADKGIAAVPAEPVQEAATAESEVTAENNAADSETKPQEASVGCGCPVDTSCEARSTDRADRRDLTVEIPLDKVQVGNVTKLLDAKGSLIKKALGVDDLRFEIRDDRIAFPWFDEVDADSAKAYTHFISALCRMAKEAKRVTVKEKETENEKYAFRCFLLRLGFIGAEYKAERKILLKNLTGSSAFKTENPKTESIQPEPVNQSMRVDDPTMTEELLDELLIQQINDGFGGDCDEISE